MNYVRSPINYTGSKYKLLDNIIPIFPNNINTFLDVFGGSGVVALNVDANNVIYNEFNTHLYKIINELKEHNPEYVINHINNRIKEFDLKKGYCKKELSNEEVIENRESKENHLKFREYLNNESKTKPLDLLTIHYYSFNNLIRHTKRSPYKFNTPTGTGSKQYSSKVHDPLIINACNKLKNIETLNKDFRDIDYSVLKENDFVYFDPPYFLSNAEYNAGWKEREEYDLYDICDDLNKRNIKWAMSNMLVNNEIEHKILKKWCEDNNYKITVIEANYNGWSQHKKVSYTKTKEVLITNY